MSEKSPTYGANTTRPYYERFSLTQRIEHLVMLVSFTMLAITGLPQKFPLNGVSQWIVGLFGGVENLRSIHHIAAIVLILVSIYHFLMLGYDLYVKRVRMSMLPTFQDGKDALQAFLYNVGLAKHRPQIGRFGFEEKAEYWALLWGTVVMALTGFMMWNPVATTQLLPGQVIPAAKAAHGAEAVLAVLAILVWHFYGVHLKFFNKAMWTGKLTEEEMLHEHPLELADVKAGVAERPVDPAQVKKRRMIYYPVAATLGILLLFGVYAFATMENTALATLPLQNGGQPVYSPQTSTPLPTRIPTATPLPTETPTELPAGATAEPTTTVAALTYDGVAGPLFQQKCSACHGAAAMAGLNLTTYADAMKGGKDGVVILPGDPDHSKLVQIQQAGGHPGQLSDDELAQIIAWIAGGALEK
jgi:cytochrome b subunit of formate dehydrogenase/mono/diheme cytochrome c family protein